MSALRLTRLCQLSAARCSHAELDVFSAISGGGFGTAAPAASTFRYQDLEKELVPFREPDYKLEDLKFGHTFTDHLLVAEHVDGMGWSRPQIRPFSQGITVHPAAQVLHYGMCCFEGMKAYLGVDGRGRLFRPDMNMARLHRSSQRLMLADFDPGELLDCLKELLRVERRWLPACEGYSLYVRPFMFSSAHNLGIGRPARTTLAVMLSPVGPYFATGLTPVRLFLDEVHVRAWPGGVGDAKVGANYAPTILPQALAAGHGAPQVLYTLPVERTDPDTALISESGAMNVFFLLDKADGTGRRLVTPPLDGTILPGVTRDSVLALARAWGECEVAETNITIRQLSQAAREGRLREMFGCGTACIIQPIDGLVRASGEVIASPWDAADPGSLTQRLTRALTDVFYGRVASDWSVPFEEAADDDKAPRALMSGEA